MAFGSATEGREKANALVASFGKRVGKYDAALGPDDDVSFGECGFHYDRDRDELVGRVYVNRAFSRGATDETKDKHRRVAAALDDPKIGGMFEHGGGSFLLDEEKSAYFLVKRFPLATTTPNGLVSEMEDLLNIAAAWTTRWLSRVAGIVHGWEPAPTVPVTRANDRP